MKLFLLAILTGITSSQGKIIISTDNIYLQPGEVKTTSIVSNASKACKLMLRTKLPHIAVVHPSHHEIDMNHSSFDVHITGNQLGYTQVVAAINISNVFSFEDGLVQITILQYHWIRALSTACGWIYFSAWTFSFYPQILINMRRKSVVGLNFDFLALNELGFLCYSVFNCCLYFVHSIQGEYFQRHSGASNPVLLNDVLFSIHGLLATTVIILQVFKYERGNQTISHTALVLLSSGVCVFIGILLAAAQGCIAWLDAIVWISFIKLMVTIIKYIPQALMNYRNKSTEGWSIQCILCDLTGSCFSLLQMILNSYNCDDWVSIMGDPTKFGLGMFSIGFDLIFIIQHYILYSSPQDKMRKEEQKKFYSILRETLLNKMLWISENTNK